MTKLYACSAAMLFYRISLPKTSMSETWSKTWFYAGFEQDRSNGIGHNYALKHDVMMTVMWLSVVVRWTDGLRGPGLLY